MKETKTFIDVQGVDISRPSERPPKTNWRIEMVKKALGLLQHASPSKSAEIVWHYFTMPGKVRFTENQQKLVEKAETYTYTYKGDQIKGYRWGSGKRKLLVCHGWRSKTADFRNMIESFVDAGFTVEGIDLRAHGNSEGKHTALPEYRDILKNHYAENGPYEIAIGYSLGGLALGLVLSELSESLHPKHFFVISAPPYVSYFFKDIITSVGLNDRVYEAFKNNVQKVYHQPAEYFDLRDKYSKLKSIDLHILHSEDDQVVPFEKGQELEAEWESANFVHINGLGHYKVINNDLVIEYIMNHV